MEVLVERCDEEAISQSFFVDNFDFSVLVGEIFHAIAVCVTPICDIAQGKADYYTFCAVLPINPWLAVQKNPGSALADLIRGKMYRYHWIGELPGKEGCYYFVDYQASVAVRKEVVGGLRPFAKARSSLAEALPVGYGRNFSRVGLPFEDADYKRIQQAVLGGFSQNQPGGSGTFSTP